MSAKIQRFTILFVLFSCTLMLCIQSVSAVQTNDSDKYTFANYGGEEYTPQPMEFGSNLVNGTLQENASIANETARKHVLLQVYTNTTNEQILSLNDYGVQILDLAEDNTFIVSMPKDFTAADLPDDSGLRWMGELPVENKYDPIFGLSAPEWARTEDGQVEVEVNFYKDISSEEALDVASKYSSSTPQLFVSSHVAYYIITSESNLTSIANEDIVQYVLFPPSKSEPDLSENISGEIEGTTKKSSGFQFAFTALMILCAIVYCEKGERR